VTVIRRLLASMSRPSRRSRRRAGEPPCCAPSGLLALTFTLSSGCRDGSAFGRRPFTSRCVRVTARTGMPSKKPAGRLRNLLPSRYDQRELPAIDAVECGTLLFRVCGTMRGKILCWLSRCSRERVRRRRAAPALRREPATHPVRPTSPRRSPSHQAPLPAGPWKRPFGNGCFLY